MASLLKTYKNTIYQRIDCIFFIKKNYIKTPYLLYQTKKNNKGGVPMKINWIEWNKKQESYKKNIKKISKNMSREEEKKLFALLQRNCVLEKEYPDENWRTSCQTFYDFIEKIHSA